MSEVPYWADQMPSDLPNADDVEAHLGGHYSYTNMDRPTLDYLIEHFGVTSMLDVGCGTGGMVEYARSKGVDAHGVDGDPNMAKEFVQTHDFTKGDYDPGRRFDLIWCVEFVEHVSHLFISNFLRTFDYADVIMMTHAMPKQGGKHHVNLQWADYWIIQMQARGWELDLEATNHIRTYSQIIPYIKHSAMVWRKKT